MARPPLSLTSGRETATMLTDPSTIAIWKSASAKSKLGSRLAARSLEWLGAGWFLALLWVRTLVRFYVRVAKSHFPFSDCVIAPLGLPLFAVLLVQSWYRHRILKRVSWKGRSYGT